MTADAFAALAELSERRRWFDLVIVDPPAFASRRKDFEKAVRAYGHLARLALSVLAPGGTLAMASCSSRVSAEDFFTAVKQAAIRAGRPLSEIERTGHGIDHPVRFPEGSYLKCLFASAS
jgi:23S rRNA (cytosine1962-C5)-methyltransferase